MFIAMRNSCPRSMQTDKKSKGGWVVVCGQTPLQLLSLAPDGNMKCLAR